jgi:hypothetical protein
MSPEDHLSRSAETPALQVSDIVEAGGLLKTIYLVIRDLKIYLETVRQDKRRACRSQRCRHRQVPTKVT